MRRGCLGFVRRIGRRHLEPGRRDPVRDRRHRLAADPHLLGPADLVTLSRALLACAVAALTAELLAGHPVTVPLLALGIPALALSPASIALTLAHTDWQGRKINFLDVPGDPSFQGEARCALRVVEGALVVVNGVMGLEVGTARVKHMADDLGLAQIGRAHV